MLRPPATGSQALEGFVNVKNFFFADVKPTTADAFNGGNDLVSYAGNALIGKTLFSADSDQQHEQFESEIAGFKEQATALASANGVTLVEVATDPQLFGSFGVDRPILTMFFQWFLANWEKLLPLIMKPAV
jgi:hypothetical protein